MSKPDLCGFRSSDIRNPVFRVILGIDYTVRVVSEVLERYKLVRPCRSEVRGTLMDTSGPDPPGIFKYSIEELMVVFDLLTRVRVSKCHLSKM